MKKVILIAAVLLTSVGLYSCEQDSADETQALYENLQAGDDDPTDGDDRGSGN
ncbi:hypothetical protein [Maribacter sp. 2-571]|uniref:hypothetical protein n=1 Tax=Maribacter sp. 2-571 TaxID=3417569 RepID=UPI003D347055